MIGLQRQSEPIWHLLSTQNIRNHSAISMMSRGQRTGCSGRASHVPSLAPLVAEVTVVPLGHTWGNEFTRNERALAWNDVRPI